MKKTPSSILKAALSRPLVEKLVVMVSYSKGKPVTQTEALEEAVKYYLSKR